MFDNAHKHPDGQRQRQTDIVNNFFDRNDKGKLEVNLRKPLFEEGLKHYNKDFARKTNCAVPKLLKANEFKDGMEGLERAIKVMVATHK